MYKLLLLLLSPIALLTLILVLSSGDYVFNNLSVFLFVFVVVFLIKFLLKLVNRAKV